MQPRPEGLQDINKSSHMRRLLSKRNQIVSALLRAPRQLLLAIRPKPQGAAQAVQASAPELASRWATLQRDFFPEHPGLLEYQVLWSGRRQRRTLASCNCQKKRVSVAKELQVAEYSHLLDPLLYHEMCHAALENRVSRRAGKTLWHGPEFKRLLARHPETTDLKSWLHHGGWARAVRQARARSAAARRRKLKR